jgi:hypothetical protein
MQLDLATGSPFDTITDKVKSGQISALSGLRLVTDKASKTEPRWWDRYLCHIEELLELAEPSWTGEPQYIPGTHPAAHEVIWAGPADFYIWANNQFGGIWDVGENIKAYIQAATSDEKTKVANAGQAARDAEIRAARKEGRTQAELAQEYGIHQSEVSRIMGNVPHKPRSLPQVRLQLSAGTSPEAAAARIRERLGDQFADALCTALSNTC